MPNRIRWIKGGSAYSTVQRTADRQFLFKPDNDTRAIIGGAAARALNKHFGREGAFCDRRPPSR